MKSAANRAGWAFLVSLFALAACTTTAVKDGAPTELALNAERVAELRGPDLIANYYPAESDGPGPAILLLGGSEGGLSPLVAEEAFKLRGAGYSVLQLSYYRSPGQEENLEMVPLEVFDRGLNWLSARPEVDAEKLGIMGTSKGAEAALITAERHPQAFAAVVAVVPSNVSWQGINWAFDGRPAEASWSLNGEAYPYLPYGAWEAEKGLYSLYDNGLNAVSEHEDALIEIELVDHVIEHTLGLAVVRYSLGGSPHEILTRTLTMALNAGYTVDESRGNVLVVYMDGFPASGGEAHFLLYGGIAGEVEELAMDTSFYSQRIFGTQFLVLE